MKKMRMLLFSLASISLVSLAFIGSEKKITGIKQKQGVRKIVIDPGHGGSDGGARGKYSHEAAIALAVSLKLEAEIKKEMPDVEVYMTRTTDVFDHVRVKAEKANAAKGDLFISIHCNDAAPSRHSELIGYKTVKYKKGKKWKTKEVPQYRTYTTPSSAKGTETYIWGVDKNDDKERALRENESIYSDSLAKDDLSDDKDQLIAISLRMQQYAERSRNLAFTVQDEFVKVGRVNRDARQRAVGIWVLQAVAMPAILIELGFISNPEEEAYLNSEEGQKELSQSISRAVKRYKTAIEAKMINNNTNK
ncbi:MAG: N-acetylmuramoyl-L-alanine amidase family protein [Chitinophagaceae bacterium]